jgi:hypothetical protein
MIEVNDTLGLMVWLINFLADRFGNKAILKGGMELRLLDCPRYTNDIDYIFVPFSSKKDVSELVLDAFSQVPDLRTEHSLNSKCFRCLCEYNGIRVQIEINAAMECESQELTTATLAKAANQQGRIVRGMRFDMALAHKMAAWNERRLVRDLYDCYFMADVLEVRPHIPTLTQRLAQSEIRSGRKSKRVSLTITDFDAALRKTLSSLTQAGVEEQMRDFLSPEDLPGLEKKIRIGVNKLLNALDENSLKV